MIVRRAVFVWLLLTVPAACAADRPSIPPDDVAAARRLLEAERAEARSGVGLDAAAQARRLIELGLWEEAEAVIAEAAPSPEVRLAAAELHFRRHRYPEAEAIVEEVLAADPANHEARLLRGRLAVQAWDLEAAAAEAESLLGERGRDVEAALLLGRIRLLEKRYDEALEWVRRVQRWDRREAGAYLLEADVRFWDQDPARAEAPLARALELDPLDADARFAYGYAIWRRVDATQLGAMAAQWELALEVDPLHYVTHWHWGNGHTHLTYADYAHPTDSIVRDRLLEVRARLARNEVGEAIERSREIEREFPESVLPALTRGSAFYMAEALPPAERLDSAEATFRRILERKRHYGPAHNGLAAVIKKRQFLYLRTYDSLEAVIASTPLPDDPVFDAVFRDVRAYPGDRVRRMVRRQLGPSIAYVPLLHRLGLTFTIPPLHVDLAEAMGRPGLRTSTTFDNRQWMDIRGIGGGATGIEYVERGAHWERNVLVHEYAHLYHGRVLTDAENRRIRDLYHRAMAEGRALDYYAANNEHEFFAQAYEAYLSPVKVHPLNHKSMNTRADLERRDPATFAFIDSLVARQEAAIAGDPAALRSNWAQVYTSLAAAERRTAAGRGGPAGRGLGRGRTAGAGLATARALLDSALVHDPEYLPAFLEYAALLRDAGDFRAAGDWLDRAEAIDSGYAPIHRARAELVAAEAEAEGREGTSAALEAQVAHYERALELEHDLAERARLNQELRELYAAHGRVAEAIRTAEAYVADAPTVSTYLRDRKDEAAAFAAELRAATGHAGETLDFFADLVARKPQHYGHRLQYADALAMAGRLAEAAATLEEAQRILLAAGSPRTDYTVRIAGLRLALGDTAAARETLRPVLENPSRDAGDPRLLRILVELGEGDEVDRRLSRLAPGRSPAENAEMAFTRAWIAERRGDAASAERGYREALEANAHHLEARVRLAALLGRTGRGGERDRIAAAADSLPSPLGPDFRRLLAEALPAASR